MVFIIHPYHFKYKYHACHLPNQHVIPGNLERTRSKVVRMKSNVSNCSNHDTQVRHFQSQRSINPFYSMRNSITRFFFCSKSIQIPPKKNITKINSRTLPDLQYLLVTKEKRILSFSFLYPSLENTFVSIYFLNRFLSRQALGNRDTDQFLQERRLLF